MNTEDLLPCPFCGSTNINAAPKRGFPKQCLCEDCRAEGPGKVTTEEAIAAWNGRSNKLSFANSPVTENPSEDAFYAKAEASAAEFPVSTPNHEFFCIYCKSFHPRDQKCLMPR